MTFPCISYTFPLLPQMTFPTPFLYVSRWHSLHLSFMYPDGIPYTFPLRIQMTFPTPFRYVSRWHSLHLSFTYPDGIPYTFPLLIQMAFPRPHNIKNSHQIKVRRKLPNDYNSKQYMPQLKANQKCTIVHAIMHMYTIG